MKDNVEKQGTLKNKLGYASGDILGGGAFTLISVLFFTI